MQPDSPKHEQSAWNHPEIFESGMITGELIGYGRLSALLDPENPTEPAD